MGGGGGGSRDEPVFFSCGLDGDASCGVVAFAGFFKISTVVLILTVYRCSSAMLKLDMDELTISFRDGDLKVATGTRSTRIVAKGTYIQQREGRLDRQTNLRKATAMQKGRHRASEEIKLSTAP